VIANGEIWSPADWLQCKAESGCEDFMIGRGLLARPDLAQAIKAVARGEDYAAMSWLAVLKHVYAYYRLTAELYPKKHLGNRIKQWLVHLQRHYPEAAELFNEIRREKTAEAFEQAFQTRLGN